MDKIMRLIALLLVLVMVVGVLCSCNYEMVDLLYEYDYAYVYLPNGECVEGSVYSWMDYENSDMIQVCIDGNYYLTHSSNVVLVANNYGW